jgi:hypothetical protein
LATTKIREAVRRVYTTCCDTLWFRFGSLSVLANSIALKPRNDQDGELPVIFRIIGPDAWKKGKENEEKPKMSFSVQFKWFWTMPFRINKEYMKPMPLLFLLQKIARSFLSSKKDLRITTNKPFGRRNCLVKLGLF